jgi:hypothetical protein
MPWFVMAAQVPDGTQLISMEASSKKDALTYGAISIRKHCGLPSSHTIMPHVLEVVANEQEAQKFMDRLVHHIENSEKEN